jgi:hypothetical protein
MLCPDSDCRASICSRGSCGHRSIAVSAPARRERIAYDRGHHRAREADARDRHRSLAAFVLAGQRFDLAGEASMRVSRRRQFADRSSRMRNMWGESISVRVAKMRESSARRKRSPFRKEVNMASLKGPCLEDTNEATKVSTSSSHSAAPGGLWSGFEHRHLLIDVWTSQLPQATVNCFTIQNRRTCYACPSGRPSF